MTVTTDAIDQYAEYKRLLAKLDDTMAVVTDAQQEVSQSRDALNKVAAWRADIDERSLGWWETLSQQLGRRGKNLGSLPEPVRDAPVDSDVNALIRSASKKVRALTPLFTFAMPAVPRWLVLGIGAFLGGTLGGIAWLLWALVADRLTGGIGYVPGLLALLSGPLAGIQIARWWVRQRPELGSPNLHQPSLVTIITVGIFVELVVLGSVG